MLINGRWSDNWQPVQQSDADGRFIRQRSEFRHRIGGESEFPPAAGRYCLYVAYVCPWASRTLIALRLKGLEHAIAIHAVDPRLSDQGWAFTGDMGSDADSEHGASYLHELYTQADPDYTGRATVPVLWDTLQHTIVNNESADILTILNRDFNGEARHDTDLRPPAFESDIARIEQYLYSHFNNGVYQAGFAGSQRAYDEAVNNVFAVLNWLEERLTTNRWLVGEQLTELDIRAFVTLVRFELAYYGLFKCNLKPLSAFPAVYDYLRRLLELPAFAASVRPDHIKAGYYSIKALNPGGILPAGPELDYLPGTLGARDPAPHTVGPA